MKRVLLLAQESLYADILIQKFCALKDVEIVGLVFSDTWLSGKSKAKSFETILQKGGWGILISKFIDMVFSSAPKRSYPFPVCRMKDVNQKEALEWFKQRRPDVVFSVFFNQIIKKDFLNLVNRQVINIHPSYFPFYRGIGPTFWVLANNEKEIGVSFHYVNKGIDEGDIIAQQKITVRPDDSVHSLYLRCAQEAASMLPALMGSLAKGKITTIPQSKSTGSYYGLPDREGFKRLRSHQRSFITFRDMINIIKG